MKITKQRLQQIIKEEVEGLENEGVSDLFNKLKGSDDKTSKDVETSLDYFVKLVNSPKELQEFMNLLDDALRASTADGKLGSPEGVKAAIASFIKQVAPKVSVTIANVDLKSGGGSDAPFDINPKTKKAKKAPFDINPKTKKAPFQINPKR